MSKKVVARLSNVDNDSDKAMYLNILRSNRKLKDKVLALTAENEKLKVGVIKLTTEIERMQAEQLAIVTAIKRDYAELKQSHEMLKEAYKVLVEQGHSCGCKNKEQVSVENGEQNVENKAGFLRDLKADMFDALGTRIERAVEQRSVLGVEGSSESPKRVHTIGGADGVTGDKTDVSVTTEPTSKGNHIWDKYGLTKHMYYKRKAEGTLPLPNADGEIVDTMAERVTGVKGVHIWERYGLTKHMYYKRKAEGTLPEKIEGNEKTGE